MVYLRYDASGLRNGIGADGPGNTRITDGRPGHLSFGPYISLDPGRYVAGFYMRRIGAASTASFDMDVTAAGGKELALKRGSQADLFEDVAKLEFLTIETAERLDNVEVRLYVSGEAAIELQSLVIFSTSHRNWSAR